MNDATIVFALEYTEEGGWGAISNFITKCIEGAPMDAADVSIVTSCVLKGRGLESDITLVREAERNRGKFLKIRKPEKIYDVREKYEYVFVITVHYERLQDVVDLQNLYLIYDACRPNRVAALIDGKESEYHKTSQFFSFLTENKKSLYQSVFFKTDKIKHLQLNQIGILSRFLPLIPVNASTERFFHQNVDEFVAQGTIAQLLKESNKTENASGILAGAFRKLCENRSRLAKCDVEQCAAYLERLDVLSFLLFCFLLEGNGEGFSDYGEFCGEVQKIAIWANGCIQLIENIVFHSAKGVGVFSFRVLEGEADYVKDKYAPKERQEKWLELMVTDYSGSSCTLNLAENFRKNLADEEIESRFRKLQPRDFFIDNCEKEISEAWRAYYSEKGNVVNHYGLRIFERAVRSSKGCFIVQSHSTHKLGKGETYNDGCGKEVASKACLPGTSYSVLLPIIRGNAKANFYDYGIEDYTDKICDEDKLFDYKVIPKSLTIDESMPTAHAKADYINRQAKKLCEDIIERSIVSIDAGAIQGNRAEVVYKSVILAMLQCDKVMHVVMYDCKPEFVQMFLETAYFGWRNLKEELSREEKGQIVLYTEDYYEEILIFPEDWNRTKRINKSNNFSRETRWADYFERWQMDDESETESQEKRVIKYPFDILIEERPENTVFEKYVETVVNRSIQNPELGCKIQNVHMRLGSTIHVNHFYEAEVLFGNSFFVERFALLMIKRLLSPGQENISPIRESDQLTLYGYANYSEQTIFSTMQYLRRILPGIDVDYAILERESEDRGFTHVDRIRYSTYFGEGEKAEEERKQYFRTRKIICIIPIASTLKTNEKMINLFMEENGKESREIFFRNFELILAGPTEENEYWENEGKSILGKKGSTSPLTEFFVKVDLEYMEPLTCPMCFPEHIIDERPLIEVNAASTIPNQAFGLIEDPKGLPEINEEQLRREEQRMEVLKDVLLYRHLERNENHFLFYFQTERLIVQCSEEIISWLKGLKEKVSTGSGDYVILFCPAHFSNAGFIEFVNSFVFGSAAVVIRDDVDKEYRCNFRTKFSNLRQFVEKVMKYQSSGNGPEKRIRLFYVDDAIITGRTFHRAKSLAQSVLEDYTASDRQKYAVFDGIFVLIDRNSKSSRWQYTGVNEEECLYAFRTVHISSIRNHGDACVYCNLAKEAETLKTSAATREMENYWRNEEKKFSVKPLAVYLRDKEKSDKEQKDRAFRRLVCTNNAMLFLKDRYHGNRKEEVLEQLLRLILTGSFLHEGEEAEYFLSYCKVLSRPFRVFDKAVKEAVFDFLLVTCLCALSGRSYREVIDDNVEKIYLKREDILQRFLEVEAFVGRFFVDKTRQQDLIKVLLKQLTEMKSNFILRKSNMDLILKYADQICEEKRKEFISYYKFLIKKLTGISSDTSKSLRLDRILKDTWTENDSESRQEIYLENVWIYQDAFQKLNRRVKMDELAEGLINGKEGLTGEELLSLVEEKIGEYITPYQFKDFIELLKLYGLYEEDRLNLQGKNFVASNFLLHRFISDEFGKGLQKAEHAEEGNLAKVDYIALYMKHIMLAREVIIMMELDAEYDMWENRLIERYNALVSDQNSSDKIAQPLKKEYIILGSSEEKDGGWTLRGKEMIGLVEKVRDKKSLTEKGYSFNLKGEVFLWELGHMTEYPVYILARWEKSEQGGMQETDRLNRIRSILQFYWLLNNFVFNKDNEGFFYELARQRKKNAIHSRQKAHTHTKNDTKLEQYIHMLSLEKYGEYYQSDLLTLLADLNVSEHYRNSLTVEYYLKGVPFRAGKWNSELSLFRNVRRFYVINADSQKAKELFVSYEVIFEGDQKLREDEAVIALDYTNAERETFLLIYSLMVNAAMNRRGYEENDKVTVYCSRTPEGRLRIANRVGKDWSGENPNIKTPEKILEELSAPPEEENQGISLWSVSRYVKFVIANILDSNLRKLERRSGSVPPEELAQFRTRFEKALGEEFKIDVRVEKMGDNVYFSVLVPLLAEMYENLY